MKNSIFKSYSKKILKSEAFVSVIIVFVLAIGIISTSYALYMDVDKDTDYQLVQVGDLSIGFDKGDNTISLSNMTPSDDDIALKQTDNIFSFYIYNTGTYTADYKIKLVTTNGNEVDKQYINYKICKDNANNCEDIKTLSDATDEIIYTDELSPKKSGDATNPSSYYFIRIWINNRYTDTTSKNIKLKVVIDASNANTLLDNKNTLAGRILNDSRIKMNNDTPDFTKAETEEKGLYKAPDDYGTTYYFRGAQSYNYVSFADKIWRIVRINGDGSIRLILDDVAKDTSGYAIKTAFNSNANDNAYVGYMYGAPGSTTYDDTHKNINDSTIKQKVDKWYEDNLKTNYGEFLADTLFCNDKTLATNGIGGVTTQLGYASNKTYYASTERLRYSTGTTSITTSKPTFKCAESATNDYSRFTVDVATLSNGNKTNGNLKYPIGLLSADEVSFAGAYKYNQANRSYYLHNSSITSNWWLSSPNYSGGSDAYEWTVSDSSGILNYGNVVFNAHAFRPSINLKAELLVGGGNGTSSSPYTLKLY